MGAIVRAYARALQSMPGVVGHFIWPMLASVLLWTVLGVVFWGKLSRFLVKVLHRWPAVFSHVSDGMETVLTVTLQVSLYLISIPLVVVTATLLLEVLALPFILDKVAGKDYPQVEKRRGGTVWQSVKNTLFSSAVGLMLMALTLPLWLVPGVGVLVSLAITAWMNYRSFRFDALAMHADAWELQALPKAHRKRLLMLAGVGSTLTLIPIVNLFSVPWIGLAFLHYLIPALEQVRRDRPSSTGHLPTMEAP